MPLHDLEITNVCYDNMLLEPTKSTFYMIWYHNLLSFWSTIVLWLTYQTLALFTWEVDTDIKIINHFIISVMLHAKIHVDLSIFLLFIVKFCVNLHNQQCDIGYWHAHIHHIHVLDDISIIIMTDTIYINIYLCTACGILLPQPNVTHAFLQRHVNHI